MLFRNSLETRGRSRSISTPRRTLRAPGGVTTVLCRFTFSVEVVSSRPTRAASASVRPLDDCPAVENATTRLAYRAFEDVAHAELDADLLHVDGMALVDEA